MGGGDRGWPTVASERRERVVEAAAVDRRAHVGQPDVCGVELGED